MVNSQQVNNKYILTRVLITITATINYYCYFQDKIYLAMEYHNLDSVKMINSKIILDQCISGSPKSHNVTGGHFFTSINCRSLFMLVLFFTTLNLAHNAPLPPPVILVFSITSSNPLHMVLGDSPHVTTDITEGVFN